MVSHKPLKDEEIVSLLGSICGEFGDDIKSYFINTLIADNGARNYLEFSKYLFGTADIKGKTICDVGCGHGLIPIIFSMLGSGHAYGFDPNPNKIFVASKILQRLGLYDVSFFVGDGVNLGVHDDSFDVLLLNEVISHVRDRELFISECKRVLKTGGTMLVYDGNNSLNPLINKKQRRVWKFHEYGPVSGTGLKKPYFEMRKEILRKNLDVSGKVLEELSRVTMGFWGDELLDVAKTYLKDGITPKRPEFPYKNPVTGEYPEFLFDPYALGEKLSKEGFDVVVQPTIPVRWDRNSLRSLLRPFHPVIFRFSKSFEIIATKKR